eukprot:TRINITY_DN65499_c0_g1_i1.p3 TRINITY_DN65499_c0_g1~~TRINITY_DN65499_c0_g1_i1.p3  ORF type:complete len:172 (+),score=55.31 TRINITY_DN65499_c0_g1_i1:85-600(+)
MVLPTEQTSGFPLSARCPAGMAGTWKQDKGRSASLAPFLKGLGVPSFAAPFVDWLGVTVQVSCDSPTRLRVEDHTLFGRNVTAVELGGAEVEATAKGGRKRYMMSGVGNGPSAATIQCRLFMRGEGWYTRQEREVLPDGEWLLERNVLVRPGEEDVVVDRYFRKAPAPPVG